MLSPKKPIRWKIELFMVSLIHPNRALKVGIFMEAWDFGGIASFCLNLGNGLSDLGYDVTLLLTRACKPKDPLAKKAYQQLLGSKKFNIIDLRFQFIPKRFRKTYFRYCLEKLALDACVINNFDRYISIFKSLSRNTPLINVAHGDLSSGTYHLFAQSQNFCQAQIAISQAIYDTFLSMSAPAYHAQIHLIPHGVSFPDRPLNSWPDTLLRVVYCGRFEFAQKRVQDLPEIWEKFLAQGGKGILHVIGDGEGKGYLEQSLQKHVENGTVKIHGHLSTKEIVNILDESEIILGLSNWEGLPFSILEGVAHGCYPVLSRIRSGHPDIAHLTGGVLFPTGDNTKIAQILTDLAQDKAQLQTLRIASQKQARTNFSREIMAQRYASILNSICNN